MPDTKRPAGVSVVIPAYGREAALLRSIESVETSLPGRAEIIVVDDCSPNPLPPLLPEANASGVPVRAFRLHRNCGPQTARNLGIRRAAFSHVAFLDSDDIFAPAKMDRMIRLVLDEDPDLVFHDVEGLEREARIATLWDRRFRPAVPLGWFATAYNPVVTPSLMIRRRNRLGVPGMRHCEDYAFLFHYVEPGMRVLYLPQALAAVERAQGAAGGLSESTKAMRRGEFRARSILLRNPGLSNGLRWLMGTGFGLLRVANDLLRGRYGPLA